MFRWHFFKNKRSIVIYKGQNQRRTTCSVLPCHPSLANKRRKWITTRNSVITIVKKKVTSLAIARCPEMEATIRTIEVLNLREERLAALKNNHEGKNVNGSKKLAMIVKGGVGTCRERKNQQSKMTRKCMLSLRMVVLYCWDKKIWGLLILDLLNWYWVLCSTY